MTTLGQNISYLRKKHGLSQAQLAEKLDIGTSTLGMYETDKREPSYETLATIADFFHKSVDELLGRKINSDIKDSDLEDMLANAHSYDGKPMDDHDRALIKQYLEALFSQRDAQK